MFHLLSPHADPHIEADFDTADPAHLEEERVAGAIKTDFILSAEIMTIALAEIPEGAVWIEALTLAVVGVGITVAVYGSVALIVKMDDVGLVMAKRARLALIRALGRGLVGTMPRLMTALSLVGTAAMLWVGGSILMHGAEELGFGGPAHLIEGWAAAAAAMLPGAAGFVAWAVTAAVAGILGLGLGFLLIPLATRVFVPLWARVTAKT